MRLFYLDIIVRNPSHGRPKVKHELPAFALLIDADNVRLETLSPILEEITRHARLTVRRIYGDFTSPNLAGWKAKLAEHAILPIQQYRNTVGKNASDSALIIDAMDLLHSHRFEGFCLVSSDSDFTRLATRIREDGLTVYGFGEKKAPKAFVSACDRYIYVENLLAQGDSDVDVPPAQSGREAAPLLEVVPASTAVPPVAIADVPAEQPRNVQQLGAAPPSAPTFKPPTLAANLLLRAYTNVADETGWALLERMSSYIHANHPDFDPRSYGCAKFIGLIQRSEMFELALRPHGKGQTHFCRPVSAAERCVKAATTQKSALTAKLRDALVKAVTQSATGDGWAGISAIGQRLKAAGGSIKGSGHATLTSALKAAGRFDIKGKGAAAQFRVR